MTYLWRVKIWSSNDDEDPFDIHLLTASNDASEALKIAISGMKSMFTVWRATVKLVDELSLTGEGVEILVE